ncbi:MAG: apolipoprotein N-acyltransferase [Chlamydiales bacterium]
MDFKSRRQWLYASLAFLFVALGQAVSVPIFAFIAASFAYVLFWESLSKVESKFMRAVWSGVWFTAVQMVQLSWMTATDYQGPYIYALLLILCLGMACQFAALTILFVGKGRLTLGQVFGGASFWVLMEWSRLFLLTGFLWNPSAMALTANHYSLQVASLLGIYGLSFWVIFTNLLVLRLWRGGLKISRAIVCLLIIVLPYTFGWFHSRHHSQKMEESGKKMSVALVHTALTPDEKMPNPNQNNPYIQAFLQWQDILVLLKKYNLDNVEVIVFPESLVAFGAKNPFYPASVVQQTFQAILGKSFLEKLPPLEEPFSVQVKDQNGNQIWQVSNAYWAQAISNCFGADLIVGLDDTDREGAGIRKSYNAAFHFSPNVKAYGRYEKQILIPGSEYIPFPWVASIAAKYGIQGSFDTGESAKVFLTSQKVPFGIAICSEEIYGHRMRENRLLGAELLISMHNDVWFPHSTLASQHFQHGLVRSVENGIPLIRSTNVGITGAVDSLGRVLLTHGELWKEDVLLLSLPRYSYQTIYSKWGDIPIITFSFVNVLLFFSIRMFRKRKVT